MPSVGAVWYVINLKLNLACHKLLPHLKVYILETLLHKIYFMRKTVIIHTEKKAELLFNIFFID